MFFFDYIILILQISKNLLCFFIIFFLLIIINLFIKEKCFNKSGFIFYLDFLFFLWSGFFSIFRHFMLCFSNKLYFSLFFVSLNSFNYFDFFNYSCGYFSIFYNLFFFKFFCFVPMFELFLHFFYVTYVILLYFNYCFFFNMNILNLPIIFVFSLFTSLFFTFVFLLLFFYFLIICFLLLLLNKFFYLSVIGFLNFSKNFSKIENEDLWISCNLFYFDHKIAESNELSFSCRIYDIEVFSTLLTLFFKIPQRLFDSDYFMFSKVFQHSIFGNNPSLYNFERNRLEPFVRPIVRNQSYNFFDTLPQLLHITTGPFVQFEFRRSDFFFFRKLFKYLFLFKGKSFLKLKRQKRLFSAKFFIRRKFLFQNSIHIFRFFHGLPNDLKFSSFNSRGNRDFYVTSFQNTINASDSFSHFREIPLSYDPFHRKSRLESRFLRFFWISFPFYFLSIRSFFYNWFPFFRFNDFFLFPSKFKIIFTNFYNSLFIGKYQTIIINFPFANFISFNQITYASLKSSIMRISTILDNLFSGKEDDFLSIDGSFYKVIRFFQSRETEEEKKTQKKSKNTPNFDIDQSNVHFTFDILNVSRSEDLNDLRRINKSLIKSKSSKLKKKIINNVFSDLDETTNSSDLDDEKVNKKKKSNEDRKETNSGSNKKKKLKRNSEALKDIKNYWKKVTIRFFLKQLSKKSNLNLRQLSKIEKGVPSSFFESKKRTSYKRFFRRNSTRTRAFWINRDRFFFPNVYNNSKKDLYCQISLLDLFKLLEYFYFVLGNDRDLFDNAVYSLLVSTLREKFGSAIVKDLLSRQDHKQASKVSVIMHVKDDDISVQTESFTNTHNEFNNLFLNNPDLFSSAIERSSKNVKFSPLSLILLSPLTQNYLQELMIYYKSHTNQIKIKKD